MNYCDAFEALQREADVRLEDPLLSDLHEMLVARGDYTATEDFMEQAVSSKILFFIDFGLL